MKEQQDQTVTLSQYDSQQVHAVLMLIAKDYEVKLRQLEAKEAWEDKDYSRFEEYSSNMYYYRELAKKFKVRI